MFLHAEEGRGKEGEEKDGGGREEEDEGGRGGEEKDEEVGRDRIYE